MSLSAGVSRSNKGAGSFVMRVVKSGVSVWKGGAYAIELATGKVYRPVGNTAAEVFVGWADDDYVGDGLKAFKFLDDITVALAVTGVTGPADEGKTVYAVDDGTFSLTDSGSDLPVGKVEEWVSGTTCFVFSKRKAID